MKSVIGIIYDTNFDEDQINGACGGSETWAIQLSKELVTNGYSVIVFRQGDWQISNCLVEYCPIHMFDYICERIHFDSIIFSRNIDDLYYKIIESKCCDNIYVQAHEIYIWKNGLYNEKFDYKIDNEKYPEIKKFIALSDFHKDALTYYCNIPQEKIEIIGNGCDTSTFKEIDESNGDVNKSIEHSILWTSCFPRGCDILIDDIMPLVKKEIPDFIVKICGYIDVIPEQYRNRNDVEIVGFNLTKAEYYNELRKTACWFYPCVTGETFNISVLDAVINNCDIISPMLHGTNYTLSPFMPFAMKNKFGTGETKNKNYDWGSYTTDKSSEEYNEACQEAANMIIDSIKNYYDIERIKIRQSIKRYVLQTHNWKEVANRWKIVMNKNGKQ